MTADSELNSDGASVWTIRRLLDDNGYHARLKRPMQLLTENNKQMRFRFAKIYRKWELKKFMKIFYSDESKINVDGVGRPWVRKKDNESWCDERFRKGKTSHPLGIQIWMMISCRVVEGIKWIRGKTYIDGEYYRKEILKEFVLYDKRLNKSDKGGFLF